MIRSNSMKKALCMVLLFLLLCSFVTGCGKTSDQQITNFMNNMNTFYDKVSAKNDAINAIDPNANDSADQLLALLDGMNEDFVWLDSIPVPNEYGAVDQFANEAMQYMTEAVKLYHQAFEGDSNYENILIAARENYRRANVRISYISDILQGNEPDFETTQAAN